MISSTFQGRFNFQGLFKKALKIQVLYKPVRALDKQHFSVKILIFSYPSVLTYHVGAQKNHLIETILLSTHKICFG